MKKIQKIEPQVPVLKQKKRVAAYARISMETEKMEHSLSAQISYYNDKIQKNPIWLFAGVYADDGISGTKTDKRGEFKRLIKDCDAGKIDIVLTKSISRFARNTVDLLKTVRHLKEIGVEVWFERENIHSLDSDGELMLTILASFAQEESRSISDNCKWSIRKRFEKGLTNSHYQIYGYRWDGDELILDRAEASTVRRIFRDFLAGKSSWRIAKDLEADNIKKRNGKTWRSTDIRSILSSVTYTSDLLLQKYFVLDPIEKIKKKNCGELPQYLVKEHHEPIIDRETFDQAQSELERRKEMKAKQVDSCFKHKIKCEKCGSGMSRHIRANRAKFTLIGTKPVFWACNSRFMKNVSCNVKEIPERCLKQACAEALGIPEFDEDVFREKIDFISVPGNNVLRFHFYDGTERLQNWKSMENHRSWTEEEKARSSAYQREHVKKGQKGVTCFTTKIKCGQCGGNYQAGTDYLKTTGEKIRRFRCRSGEGCKTPGLREDRLKDMICGLLDISEFDENLFLEKVDRIIMNPPDKMTFIMTDGSVEERKYPRR